MAVEDSESVLTGEAVALDLRPTGYALRAAGSIIDWLVYFGGYIAIVLILFTLAESSATEDAVFGIVAIVAAVGALVVAPVVVETVSRGKSLGRLAVGARIVRDDGGAIGFRHAAIRALVGVFEIFMTLGGVAALIGLFSAAPSGSATSSPAPTASTSGSPASRPRSSRCPSS